MKVLVTGGAGYIGSVTSLLLAESGCDVVVFDNLKNGHRSAVLPPVRLVHGDLADADLIDRVIKGEKPDCVMHFAALIAVGESVEKPDLYFYNNVGCGLNLLNAVGKNRVPRFVFSSTAAVYGTPQDVPVTETAPLQPENPYGETKRFFEELLKVYARIYQFSYCILRYFNVAGAYKGLGEDHRPETHLIPRILRSVLHPGEKFEIYGDDYPTKDGTCVRDYIHIYDLARAHLLALRALNRENLLFNLGSETGYTVKEVFATCEKVVGEKINYRIAARRQGDVPILVASSAKIKRELGWEPKKTLEDMVRDAWEWHKAHPRGYLD
ncbi:MAG: UDP-glucose 4-epimerase GalE [candidate division WOR-3 bacterium]|jgi:UDP-glucose-4-epimerase GalE|nr:UDP-glucose 4-epimerase GalE [candidate division WOR-3 bacterium]MCR4424485.1 UDP-glucose 4-epimerase GalE [candidate division WOR-3 bacterium]MDH7519667.1 UDP-glucose 4-epimerase GalE [bacterium]